MKDSLSRQSTAGRVIDYGNGSYSVYFHASWEGTAFITITLAHPREAVRWLDNVYRATERNADWTGYFEDATSGVTEQSTCYMLRNNRWANKCEYRNEKAMGKTVYICDRPPTLPCEKLKSITCSLEALSAHATRKLSSEQAFLFERPYVMTPLEGSPFWIEIKDSDYNLQTVRDKLPACGPDLPKPVSDGFWQTYNTWTSLVCRARHWTSGEMKRCLAGKTLYMIGDSTIRQMYESITLAMGQKMDFDIIRQTWTDPALDTTMIFEFHAVIVGTYMLDFWGQKFETDILDSFTRCNYVVVLSLSYHLATWTTQSYTERLLHLRQAILRFKKRCPGAVIVVKSSHPRDHTIPSSYIHSSDWTLFDMNRILRETLEGLGVNFLDVWDMSMAFSASNDVHVSRKETRQQVDLFLSYICPSN
ncbi:NXPE family member 4-like [Ptychodera flava]|uniref:NXPE family member 4-like n=1 Tax=Ptychodera flava TaxID=63121 RepID=UPI003969D618